MAEKVTSMRLNEEDLEQFKAFAKDNGLNQQQAFNSLIALAELEKAKNVLGDRGKNIETFRSTVTKLISFYVNALEENTTAEQTIREELQKELRTKDNSISALYEQLQDLKADNNALEEDLSNAQNEIDRDMDIIKDLHDNVKNLNNQLDIANRNNNTLQEQLTEYKKYKEQYKMLEKQLEQFKAESVTKDTNISILENSNKQLKDKISNNSEMLEFYKANNAELKDTIKALEEQYKQEVSNIKEEHTKVLKERIQANTEQLQSKNDIELAKKDLEIQKLQNEIEQLKAKSNKSAKTTNNK